MALDVLEIEAEAAPESFPSVLRMLVDLRDRQVQKTRIQMGNRLAAIASGADPTIGGDQVDLIKYYAKVFDELEEQIDADIHKIVKTYPIYAQVSKVKGIGPTLGAKMLALIDITNKETASQLWRFAGYGVIDGHAEKPVSGQKLTYSQRLKTTLYLVGESFLRSGSPYRRVYDEAKVQYAAAHPDWTKLHAHRAAQRKMVKLFLTHLWERWRALEGLPTRRPFVVEFLGHPDRPELNPEAFGWP